VVPVVCAEGVHENDKHRRGVLIYLRAATEAVCFIILFFSRYTPEDLHPVQSHARHVIIRDRRRRRRRLERRTDIVYSLCVCVRVYVCVCVCTWA